MTKKEEFTIGNYTGDLELLDKAQVENITGSQLYRVRSTSTQGAITTVKKLVNDDKIGNIISIAHCRSHKAIMPVTVFLGDTGLIIERGGLGSGYSGEGPRGLETLLKEFGLCFSSDWLFGHKGYKDGCTLFEK